jgi:hypothetical protein
MMNTAIRVILSKILPQLFFPPVALTFASGSNEHQGKPLSTLYRETLKRGNETTRNLWILLGAICAVCVAKFVV